MKKRRILVSLALASGALFSLAACGKTESTPTPTPAPTSAAPAPATSTAPAASSTPAASSSAQATDKVTVKYIAKYSDGVDDEELTALATQIDKNTKATAPAENPTKDGYVFKGYRNKTTHLPFDFDANITKNTDIVAYFYKPGTYDEIAASDDVVMAYDFDDAEIGAKIPAYDANVTGLSNDKNADADTYGATVVVGDYHNKLKTYDMGSGQTKVLFNVKDVIENSKVTIFTKFKLDGTMGSKWPFIEILTDNGTDRVSAFGFGGDSNKKIGYRLGSSETYENFKNELLEADKEYNALFEVDTNAQTIKLTLNGEAFAPVTVDFDNFAGVKFVTGGSAGTYTGHSDERFIIIDQFAVKAEANDIATVKAGAKASVKAVYDAYVTSDKDSHLDDDLEWKAVLDEYNAAYTETTGTIDAATTVADVKTARDAAIRDIKAAVTSLRNAKVEEINTLLAANDTTNPTNPAGTWFWKNGDAATDKYLDRYNTADTTKQAEFVTALNTLKTTYRAQIAGLKNIKEGYALLGEFETAANAIVLPKVDVTVKYYKYQYTEATGITAWAENTDYYTESGKIYSIVDQSKTTTPSTSVKYYTRSIVSAGSDGTFKTIKDEKTNSSLVPQIAGFFNVEYYSNATLETAFDFANTTIAAGDTIIHVLVTDVLYWNVNRITPVPTMADAGNSITLDAGTELLQNVTTAGDVKAKLNGSAESGKEKENSAFIGHEVGKNKTGSIDITVEKDRNIIVTFEISSTSKKNTSDKVKLVDSTNATVAMTSYDVTGVTTEGASTETPGSVTDNVLLAAGTGVPAKVTYTLSEGTYKLLSESSARGFRVISIKIELA